MLCIHRDDCTIVATGYRGVEGDPPLIISYFRCALCSKNIGIGGVGRIPCTDPCCWTFCHVDLGVRIALEVHGVVEIARRQKLTKQFLPTHPPKKEK